MTADRGDAPRAPASASGPSRLHVTVSGRVQGVGFRWFAATEASALGCVGWVANRPDGSVEVVAEGDRDALAALAARLEQGPVGAWVEDMRVRWGTPTGEFATFRVRSGSHPGD